MPRCRFDDLEKSESEKPDGRDAEQDAAVGLMLHGPQHACEADGFARIGIERGDTQDYPEQKEDDAARQNSVRPERDRYDSLPRRGVEVMTVRRAERLHRESDPDGGKSDRDQRDRGASERLRHDPRRPLACRLILADAAPAIGDVRGRGGEREIKQAAGRQHAPPHQAIEVAAVQVDVEHRLQQAPAGETAKAGGEKPKKISAERLLKRELQGIACTLRMRAETAGGKKGKAPDNQKHDAARAIADAHHPDEQPARQKPRLNAALGPFIHL
jgi:hypothetical protein